MEGSLTPPAFRPKRPVPEEEPLASVEGAAESDDLPKPGRNDGGPIAAQLKAAPPDSLS